MSRHLLATIISLTLAALTACRPAAETPATPSPDATVLTGKSVEGSASHAGPRPLPAGSGRLAGTGIGPAVDDPGQGGWTTERFHVETGAQLGRLKKLLAGRQPIVPGKLEGIVGAEFVGAPVRPAVEVAFEGSALTIFQQSATATGPTLRGTEELSASLESLRTLFADAASTHIKFKTFRVELDETKEDGKAAGGTISAYVQLDAEGGSAGVARTAQSNAVWKIGWGRPTPDSPPLIETLQVIDHVEVRRAERVTMPAERPFFADCTDAILGGLDTFREQLAPSIDHWLGEIEMHHQIDVGGWQGVSIADVDGDDLDDFYVAQPGGLPNRLFVQQADGTVADVSEKAGVDWIESTHGSLFVDLDQDGDQDLLVGVDMGILVHENAGDGTFTVRARKLLPAALPYSIAAADYDLDGDLDIFVTCYNPRRGVQRHILFARPVPYHDAENGGRNALFRNDGEWRLREVTRAVGLDVHNTRFSYAAAWEDYDDDGDPDLYVANDFGRNNLYRNDGGRFFDVASEAGVEDISPGMSAIWGDYDNDGRADLYISNMFSSAGNRIAFQSRFQGDVDRATREAFQRHARGNTLLRNLGDGRFDDVSVAAGVTLGRWAWGSRFVDLDLDGWQDIVVANGFITQEDTGDL